MSDKETSEPMDFHLAKSIRELDKEIQPSRDLWAGIERNIVHLPQRKLHDRMQEWMPYGMAASVVLAMAAVLISLNNPLPTAETLPVSMDMVMGQMKSEYMQVRNPMVEQFNETNKDLDPTTMQELHRNLEILELARKQIEDQIRQDPENTRHVEMLMRVHEQELDLLKRDFTSPSRTM